MVLFVKENVLEYKGVKFWSIFPMDVDKLLYFEVKRYAKNIGISNTYEFYYLNFEGLDFYFGETKRVDKNKREEVVGC